MIARAHEIGAWIVIVSHALVGLWALTGHLVEAARSRVMWWAIGAAQVGVFVQVGLGVAAMQSLPDDVEVADLHMFYGFLCIVSIGILVAYRQQLEEHRHLVYGAGSLWIMGLAIRALTLDALAG